MNGKIKYFGIISGIIAFILCLIAGLWILTSVGFDYGNDVVSTGLGLYFIGKAFFVGPLLIVTSLQKKINR